MKHKVRELEGALLDAAVAKALGKPDDGEDLASVWSPPDWFPYAPDHDQQFGDRFTPSTRWDHGGPIIERERIELASPGSHRHRGQWAAWTCVDVHEFYGATPLIAAMRVYTASVFGDEVDLP